MEAKKAALKKKIIKQLELVPIVIHACQRAGVPRATYYRWRKEDTIFAAVCDRCIERGVENINDLAESQLLTLIKVGNLGAVIFWLKSRHPAFKPPSKFIEPMKRELRPLVFFDFDRPNKKKKSA